MGVFDRLFGKDKSGQQTFVSVPDQIGLVMIKLAKRYDIKLNQSQVGFISGLQGVTFLMGSGQKPDDPKFRKDYFRAFLALYDGLSHSMLIKGRFPVVTPTEYDVKYPFNEKGIIEWNELADLFAMVNISELAEFCREIFNLGFLEAHNRNPIFGVPELLYKKFNLY